MLKQYVIALLTTAFTLFLLALFVYFRNRKGKINRAYAIFTLAAFLWSFGEALLVIAPAKEIAIFWNRVCNFGIFFIATGFIHFILVLLGIDKEESKRRIITISYIFSSLATVLLFSNTFLPPPVPKFSLNYFIEPGPFIYPLFVVLWFCQVIYGLYELIKAYIVSTGARRNQLKYLLIGALIGYIGGSGNYLLTFDIEIIPLNPFGTYGVVIYSIMMTYAILKYHLLDIKVAITRAGIFVLVYLFVLGIPFVLGYKHDQWQLATWVTVFLATLGPFIYNYLRQQAEERILKDQRRYQKTLRELSKTMTRIRDLDKLLHAIVLTVIDTVRVSFAAVYLKDEEYKSYRLRHYFPKEERGRFQEFIPLDYSLINALSVQKKPILSEEAGHQDKLSLDSGLVIPCFMEDDLLGFLVLGAKPKNQMYTTDDVLVFETLSYSTSLAIENCHFWKEIEDRQRKARLQEMDTYSYSLAHEIDNPMQTVIGQTELLQKYLLKELNLTEEKQQDLSTSFDFILEAARRVSGMVKAIREFGQKTTGEFKPLKIDDAVESFAKLYYPQFKDKTVFFEKTSHLKNPVFVLGEKPELMQVLVILANNSLHAMAYSKEKKIALRLEQLNPDFVRISFTDTGCGIKKELLPIIFSPFTTTKASSEGTGMGLYNAKKIIDRHKGRIWVESEGENKGVTFFIELPIAKDITPGGLEDKDKGKRLF